MATDTDNPVVIIDNGSGVMKVGLSGGDLPSHVFPSVVGRPRHKGVMVGFHSGPYVGEEARCKRGILSLKHPVEHGIVNNWDDAVHIWHHAFYNELRIAPEQHTVLLTETALNPRANREKMTQIMFETFNTPAFYVANQAILSLFAGNKLNGVVIESGYTRTRITPCYEGIALRHAFAGLDFGGQEVTDYLMDLLNQRGYSLTSTSTERAIVADIKQELGFIALDYDNALEAAETSSDGEVNYELPDGQVITIGPELFQCVEVLFKPSLVGLEQDGIHHGLCNSIKKCDAEMQNELFENIVLSGGNTMFNGFDQRLVKEVKALVSNKILIDGYLREMNKKQPTKALYKDIVGLLNDFTSFRPDVGTSKKESRFCLPWIGGFVMSSTSEFKDICITAGEYDEIGPAIVHRKCTV
eukprot:1340_1